MKQETFERTDDKASRKSSFSIVLQIFLIIVVLGLGITLAAYYLKTSPKAKPRKRQPNPPLVRVEPISFQDHQLTIEGMGTIIAAREIDLAPGVSGEVVGVNPNLIPGGSIAGGETLVNIDPTDYELAALELQNEVDIANLELDLEMGNQRIAQKELEILGEDVSETEKSLMLRKPQLKMKQATLKNKQAKLAQAELNLSRTSVVAPFNSIVASTSVTLGSRVSQSSPVARLVGTDECWVKMLLPVEKLKWLEIPKNNQGSGSSVRIYLENKPDSLYRVGRVSKLAAKLEEQGKLAVVYAVVKDPLSLLEENENKPRLLLGSFVRAEIEGITLKEVLAIDRNHLRENNSVWILDNEKRLDIRSVRIIARNRDQVFIDNSLKSGEQLIISALSAPVEGTELDLLQDGKRDTPKMRLESTD